MMDCNAGLRPQSDSNVFARHLAELRDAHRQLLVAMDAMDSITSADRAADYRQARFKLSSTSLNRRMLWQRIFRLLEAIATPPDGVALAALQAADLALLRASSMHVSKWTAERIERRWDDYCRDSREIRAKMKAAILTEKHVIYPILERYSRTAKAA